MARQQNYKTFYQLIALIIAFIVGAIKFLIEVNKRGLWKECFVSVLIVGIINYLFYYLGKNGTIPSDIFIWSCIISFIIFCVYWGGLFNGKSARQFSEAQLKRNSGYWAQQQWWWTLDGWQFEEEVAKIFILNGYKATVTKGSGDGGVDIILEKEGYKAIVQCKHYKNPVPPEPIRALWGCKDDFQADEVILVASSGITQSGADFISNKPNFKVLNLDDIIYMSQNTVNYSKSNNQSNNNYISTTNTKYGRKLDI